MAEGFPPLSMVKSLGYAVYSQPPWEVKSDSTPQKYADLSREDLLWKQPKRFENFVLDK